MFIKNKKGFNLFTALISLMLLSITIVFVYNMVQTEENYLSLIDDQSRTSDLITIADISRADAFNNFVVSFREQWIKFRSNPDNQIKIQREQVMLDWDSFVKYYADDIFFDNQFENFFAQNVISSLLYTNPPIGYGIQVPDYDKIELSRIIKASFVAAGDNKLKVVDCEQNSVNCLGTLYFTIDTRNLSAEDYEKLPMIVVKRNQNDEVIQRPVFARREYKIYIPWRGFQAMRTVRNFALDAELEKKDQSEILNRSSTSQGFFNPYIHYTLNSAKLGVCDIDSCGLREDLFITTNKNYFSDVCTKPTSVSGVKANNGGGYTVVGTNINLSGNNSYSLQTSENLKPVFEDLVKTTIKNNVSARTPVQIYAGNNLKSVNDGIGVCRNSVVSQNGLNICNVSVIDVSKVTKEVLSEPSAGGIQGDSSITPVIFNPLQYNKASNIGLSLNNDNNIFILRDPTNISQDNKNFNLKCSKIEKINILFKFEDQDERYILAEDYKNIYVQLEDDYASYSFFNPSQTFSFGTPGYFQNQVILNNPLTSGWRCKSYEAGLPGTAGCVAQ